MHSIVSRSKSIAVLIYLGAVVVGAVIGVALDRTVVRDWMEQRARDAGVQRQSFATRLSLTPAQQASADSIFGDARRRMDSLFAPLMPQRDSIRKAASERFRAQLTAEQQRIYDENQARRSRPNTGPGDGHK